MNYSVSRLFALSEFFFVYDVTGGGPPKIVLLKRTFLSLRCINSRYVFLTQLDKANLLALKNFGFGPKRFPMSIYYTYTIIYRPVPWEGCNSTIQHDTKNLTPDSDAAHRPLSNHTLTCPVPSKITKIAWYNAEPGNYYTTVINYNDKAGQALFSPQNAIYSLNSLK